MSPYIFKRQNTTLVKIIDFPFLNKNNGTFTGTLKHVIDCATSDVATDFHIRGNTEKEFAISRLVLNDHLDDEIPYVGWQWGVGYPHVYQTGAYTRAWIQLIKCKSGDTLEGVCMLPSASMNTIYNPKERSIGATTDWCTQKFKEKIYTSPTTFYVDAAGSDTGNVLNPQKGRTKELAFRTLNGFYTWFQQYYTSCKNVVIYLVVCSDLTVDKCHLNNFPAYLQIVSDGYFENQTNKVNRTLTLNGFIAIQGSCVRFSGLNFTTSSSFVDANFLVTNGAGGFSTTYINTCNFTLNANHYLLSMSYGTYVQVLGPISITGNSSRPLFQAAELSKLVFNPINNIPCTLNVYGAYTGGIVECSHAEISFHNTTTCTGTNTGKKYNLVNRGMLNFNGKGDGILVGNAGTNDGTGLVV